MKKMFSLMTLIIVGFMVAGSSVKHTIETTKKLVNPVDKNQSLKA